jgi:hypothetical protein
MGKTVKIQATHLFSNTRYISEADDSIKAFNNKHGEWNQEYRENLNPMLKKLEIH